MSVSKLYVEEFERACGDAELADHALIGLETELPIRGAN